MDKNSLFLTFEDEDQEFTGEELAIFKRYIEENVAVSENNFEFLEDNLGFYSSRYTNEHYFSPAEYFQANSNFHGNDEFKKNLELYNRSIEWYSSTVHPEDSEYVLKEEKYMYLEEFSGVSVDFINYLNTFPKSEFHVFDILLFIDGDFYQYLPQKNFLFKWKKNAFRVVNELRNANYFSMKQEHEDLILDSNPIVILPIFAPIRKMLFLGEYGYRSGMIEYGRFIEKAKTFLHSRQVKHECLEFFENHKVNDVLGLDGIERSVFSIILFKNE